LGLEGGGRKSVVFNGGRKEPINMKLVADPSLADQSEELQLEKKK